MAFDQHPRMSPALLLAAAFPLVATVLFLLADGFDVIVTSHWAVVVTLLLPLIFLRRQILGALPTRAHVAMGLVCLLLVLWMTLLAAWYGFAPRMLFGRIASLGAAIAILIGMVSGPVPQRRFWRLAGCCTAIGFLLTLAVAGLHRIFDRSASPFVLADLTFQLNLGLPFVLAGSVALWHDRRSVSGRRLWTEAGLLIAGLLAILILALTPVHIRRGVLVAVPCALAVLAGMSLWRRWGRLSLVVLLLPVAVGALLVWLLHGLPAGHPRVWRFSAYRTALAMTVESRGLGRGHYGFHRTYQSETDSARHLVAARTTDTDAHNEVLDVLVDAGLPGLLGLVILAWLCLRHWHRLRDTAVRRTWAVWAAAMAVPVLCSKGTSMPYGYAVLAIGVGALLAAPRRDAGPPDRSPMPLWFSLPACLVCVPIGLLMLLPARLRMADEGAYHIALERIDNVLTKDFTDIAGLALASEGARLACPIDAEGIPRGDPAKAVELIEQGIALEGERPKLLAQRLVYLIRNPSTHPLVLIRQTDRVLRHYPCDIGFHTRLAGLLDEFPRYESELSDPVRRRLAILADPTAGSCPDREFSDFDGAIAFTMQLHVALAEETLAWPRVQADVRRLLHVYGDIPELAYVCLRCLARARSRGYTTEWFSDYLPALRRALREHRSGRELLKDLTG